MKNRYDTLLEKAYELMQLNELFESPYTSSDMEQGPRGEDVYTFSPSGSPEQFPKYRVFFALDVYSGELDIRFDYQASPESKPTMDLTGTGNASRVMATVMAITKKHLDLLIKNAQAVNFDLQYAKITFSGKLSEKGRVKFYDNTLATLLLRFLNQKTPQIQWSLKVEENPTNINSAKGYIFEARPKRNQSPEEEKTTKPSLNKFL